MPVHKALHSAEADKCRQHCVSRLGSLLPGDEKCYPLVHHCTCLLGAVAFDFGNFIMRDIATKPALADGTPWQLAIGRTWGSVCQQLTFAHLYRACGATL
eukprot:139091-Amphidinium_carterae.1